MAINPTNSKKSWTEFFTEATYSAYSTVASKTQRVWDCAPQLIKNSVEAWQTASPLMRVPLKAATIYFVPGGLLFQGAATVAAVWSETPTEVVGAIRGNPVNMMGHRFALTQGPDTFSLNEKEPLDQLTANIEQCEAISTGKQNPEASAIPLSPAELEAETNKKLETLIQKVSCFSTLYTLHSYICEIKEENYYDSLVSLVASASKSTANGKQPSLWKLFYKKYKDKLSFPQIVKAGLFYFFCNYIPIIPNTINAYMKNLLGVVRDKLKKDSVSKNQFIQQIISDNKKLLSIINGAVRNFAERKDLPGKPTGSPIEDYISDAIDQLVGISEEDLPSKFTDALIDQYPTRIPFKFGERILNWIIPRVLKKWVLPNVTSSLIKKSNKQLKKNKVVPVLVPGQNGTQNTEQRLQFYTPFFLALTETLVHQMETFQKNLEKDRKEDPVIAFQAKSKDSINLIDTEGLSGLIANLIEATHLLGATTTHAKPKKSDELDTQIKEGIKGGLVEGTHSLINYLADPNNTEGMFAKLLGLLDGPFCREEPKTESEWNRESNAYKDSKKQLRKISKEIFKGIIDSAVEKAAGDTPAEKTEAIAKAIFEEHQQNGLSSFEQLQTSITQIETKLNRPETEWSEEQSLHTEIEEICSVLKNFKNVEEIEEEIDNLSSAEQASIRLVLKPIYEGANQVMESTLMLQQAEIEYAQNARNVDRFNKTKTELLHIKQILTANRADIKISELKTSRQKIETQLKKLEKEAPLPSAQIEELLSLFIEISDKTASIEAELATLANITQLHRLSNDFIAFINFNKKQCIPEIIEIIKTILPDHTEQARLFYLMHNINQWDRKTGPLPEGLTKPLVKELKQLKTAQNEKITPLIQQLNEKQTTFTNLVNRHEEQLKRKKETDELLMKRLTQGIKTIISTLHSTIQESEKESQIQLRSENSKLILGSLGALFGMGASLALNRIAPAYAAPAITGFLATGFYHSKDLLTGGSSTKIKTLGKMFAGAGASAGATVAATSTFPVTVAPAVLTMIQSYWLGRTAASVIEHNIEIPKNQVKAKAMEQVTEIFDKAYDHILTSSSFYEGNRRLFMKNFIQTHGA